MREYKAARRKAKLEPVQFACSYLVDEIPEGAKEPVEVEKREVFTCKGDMSGLSLSDMASFADIDSNSTEGLSIMAEVFREMFGDDGEFRRFKKFQAEHLDGDDLVDIIGGLIEDFAGRPTQPPSDSPSSSSTDGRDSKEHSSLEEPSHSAADISSSV